MIGFSRKERPSLCAYDPLDFSDIYSISVIRNGVEEIQIYAGVAVMADPQKYVQQYQYIFENYYRYCMKLSADLGVIVRLSEYYGIALPALNELPYGSLNEKTRFAPVIRYSFYAQQQMQQAVRPNAKVSKHRK